MLEPFLGTIAFFGFNFAPRGWATCEGQMMGIAQHSALFALLGNQYGGDGRVTFALPDLRGRFPMGRGQGQGLPPYTQGQMGGAPHVTLTQNNLPAHTHGVATSTQSTSKAPQGNVPAVSTGGAAYGSTPNGGAMNPGMIQPAGGSQPFSTMPPYLVGNWCIAIEGVFPSRD
ncbi:tail fiber protein [Tessaracoccus lubricantis]|uniref:Tail fiber protein n=1 Tax=Tessaracoccus lubricantis TaxID=545543 RepID=A0ABP9F3Y4_9ACTN